MKTALVKIDLNIPMDSFDHPKVRTLKSILEYYSQRHEIIVLCSHLGQPKAFDPKLSFEPLCQSLSQKIGFSIKFLDSPVRPKQPGIYLLENIRFDARELKACPDMSIELESIADTVYFEALACCHRKHTSVYNLSHSSKATLGHFARKELSHWSKIAKSAKVLYLVGGAKAKTKIPFVDKLSKQHCVYVFGALAHCYLQDQMNLGASYIPKSPESNSIEHITIPTDFVWQSNDTNETYCSSNYKHHDDYIIDIGKQSIDTIKQMIDRSDLVIWLGPSCWFEKIEGQNSIDKIMTYLLSIDKEFYIGGGETAQAVLQSYPQLRSKIFDAGGALLAYLSKSQLYLPEAWLHTLEKQCS